ncbi:Hypothetical predicted protein [Lynx pardinus]|uniref:Uncharacterized protein n=1 Tax=Lynx pardinus TaxID=191816 RepID=A0A485MSL7_LYNPA|nr:Hypothetical predicted protein [Lynx pardinus]
MEQGQQIAHFYATQLLLSHGDLVLFLLDFPLNLAVLTEKDSMCLVSRVLFLKTVLLLKSRFSST